MTASTSSSGADAPAVTPTMPGEVVGELGGRVDPVHPRAAGLAGELLEGHGVGRVGRPDHDHGVAAGGDLPSAPTGGWWWRSTGRCGRGSTGRGSAPGWRRATPSQSRWLTAWSGRAGRPARRTSGSAATSSTDLDPVDGVGGDGHGADGLLVALVADVDDLVALAGPHLDLVVDLGDQRAHGVDHVAAVGPGRGDHLGGRAVGREHDRAALGHLVDVVDEDHARGPRSAAPPSWLCTISW